MYNRITFNYDGIITKGILLAECDFIETISYQSKRNFCFSSIILEVLIKENLKCILFSFHGSMQ